MSDQLAAVPFLLAVFVFLGAPYFTKVAKAGMSRAAGRQQGEESTIDWAIDLTQAVSVILLPATALVYARSDEHWALIVGILAALAAPMAAFVVSNLGNPASYAKGRFWKYASPLGIVGIVLNGLVAIALYTGWGVSPDSTHLLPAGDVVSVKHVDHDSLNHYRVTLNVKGGQAALGGRTVWVANAPSQAGETLFSSKNAFFAPTPCTRAKTEEWTCSEVNLGLETETAQADYNIFVALADGAGVHGITEGFRQQHDGHFAAPGNLETIDPFPYTRPAR